MSEETNPTDSKEMAQRFVQFVMIQAQNVLYVLGKIPGPDGTAPEPNLEAAKMLIDQLDMIQTKTSGNLSDQEAKILKDTLSELQMAFVESSGGTPASMMPDRSPKVDLPDDEPEEPAPSPEPPKRPESSKEGIDPGVEPKGEDEDKKKYFKSYG